MPGSAIATARGRAAYQKKRGNDTDTCREA